MKRLVIVCALTVAAQAQQPWQRLRMATAAEVKAAWVSPAPEYGPEPYYGLNGAADITVVRRDLDTMKTMGYTAVTVQYGYGESFAYLSPEYFAFFKQFVAEARQRDMRVWIVDDAGYPSGFAGGKFTSEHPELRMQALVVVARLSATSGAQVRQAVSDATVAVTAQNAATGALVNVPVTHGAIDWTAPEGSWTVLVVEHRFMTSPTRSDTNPQRVKDGSQSLEDYLDPAATAQYLAFTHEAYRKAVGDEFGKTILGFRGDEPDYSIQGLPWTPNFFARFQQEKGYDVRPYLAAFAPPLHVPGQRDAQGTLSLSEQQRRAKADYYDVFAMMFRDGFFKPQGDWCVANHLEYQVHLNHEEMEMQLVRSEGEFFRDMRFVQVPGIDSIWHQIWTDTISDFPRLASSAAHVYGHPRAFTESFAAYRPEPDVTLARYIVNEQFVRGINLVETMYFPATSTPGRGPSKYMKDPAYPALLTYVRRMSYLMAMGRPDASVALLLPSSSMWLGDSASDMQFVSAERMLSEQQVDFDVVDEDALAAELKAERSAFVTASGNTYRVVLLPDVAVLSEAASTRLKTFAAGGGKVIFLGRTPGLIAGRTFLDARAAKADEFAWATVVPELLAETPTPPAQPPAAPPPALAVSATLLAGIKPALDAQNARLEKPDAAVRMTHRALRDGQVFLFFNESGAAISHKVNFAGRLHIAEVWDAQTGTVTPLKSFFDVPLELGPYETRLIVVR